MPVSLPVGLEGGESLVVVPGQGTVLRSVQGRLQAMQFSEPVEEGACSIFAAVAQPKL